MWKNLPVEQLKTQPLYVVLCRMVPPQTPPCTPPNVPIAKQKRRSYAPTSAGQPSITVVIRSLEKIHGSIVERCDSLCTHPKTVEIFIDLTTSEPICERTSPMRTPLGRCWRAIANPLLCAVPLFLLLPATICHAMTCITIDPYLNSPSGYVPPSTITSISPSTWVVGHSYKVLVTGVFTGNASQAAVGGGCDYSEAWVNGSSDVRITNYGESSAFISSTQMMFDVKVKGWSIFRDLRLLYDVRWQLPSSNGAYPD